MAVIGTCSECKGPVTVPDAWGGILPPTPTCANCGATPKEPHGKTIQMEKPKREIAWPLSTGSK